jgi:cysteine synthase
MTQYKTNHYHKSANSHEHNEQCGKVITQYTDSDTDVFVLWGKYMPHEHKFWTETRYLKHPRRIQQLQAPHYEAEHEMIIQCVGTNGTLHYPAFHCSSIFKRIKTSRVQHYH